MFFNNISFTVISLFLLIIFQIPIQSYFGLTSLYYILIPILFIQNLFNRFIYNSSEINFLFYFIYYSFILFAVQSPSINLTSAFYSIFGLIWPPLLFAMMRENNKLKDLNLVKPFIFITLFVSIAGIYEFFIDRDIFGLVPRIGYEELYENKSLFYRTRSILFSTQINALFLSVSSIFLFEFWPKEKIYSRFKYIFFLILLLAVFLTGSRSPIIIIGFYFVLRYKVIFDLRFFVLIFPFFLILFFSSENYLFSKSIDRQFDFFNSPGDFINKQISDRFQKQAEVFNNANLLFGNGIGRTHSSHPSYINTESYIGQIFSETGIIGLFFFSIYIINCLRRLTASPKTKILVICSLISSIFVHGLSSPYLLIFWYIINSNDEDFSKP